MYLDVDVLYALIKESDYHKPYAQRVILSEEKKYTSSVAMLELEIVVKRELGDAISLDLPNLVNHFVPKLKIVVFSNSHFEKSLELREKYGLGIFDGVHAAICLENDGRMASTDGAYDRVPGLHRAK